MVLPSMLRNAGGLLAILLVIVAGQDRVRLRLLPTADAPGESPQGRPPGPCPVQAELAGDAAPSGAGRSSGKPPNTLMLHHPARGMTIAA